MATRSVISKSIAESSSTYTGVDGELIVDTTNNTLKISDGTTAGGIGLTVPASATHLDGTDSTAAIDITKGIAVLEGNSGGDYNDYTIANGTYVGQTVTMAHKSGGWGTIRVTGYFFRDNLTEDTRTIEVFSQYDKVRTFIWTGTAWTVSRGGGSP